MPRVSWKALSVNSRQQEHHEAFGAWILSLAGHIFHFPVESSLTSYLWIIIPLPWMPDDFRPHLDKWGPPLGMPVPHVISGVLKVWEHNPGTPGTCGRP